MSKKNKDPLFDNGLRLKRNKKSSKTKQDNIVQIIDDKSFAKGFHLMGINPDLDERKIFRFLDYEKTNKEEKDPTWYMAQWWTKYNFTNARESYQDGMYIYENESRVVKVNPAKGYLYTELNAGVEYDTPRKHNESWPHILIEQFFSEEVYLKDVEKIIAKLKVKIIKVENKMSDEEYDENNHTAQLCWYFTLNNNPPEGKEDSGIIGDYLWFGIPIYDYRYPTIQKSAIIDSGFEGSTNKMIYSMSNDIYLPTPLEFNKEYSIEVDIMPYIKDAYEYAQKHNALVDVKMKNLMFRYMNFGWELPGTFNVASEIKGLDVKIYYK